MYTMLFIGQSLLFFIMYPMLRYDPNSVYMD